MGWYIHPHGAPSAALIDRDNDRYEKSSALAHPPSESVNIEVVSVVLKPNLILHDQKTVMLVIRLTHEDHDIRQSATTNERRLNNFRASMPGAGTLGFWLAALARFAEHLGGLGATDYRCVV